MYRIDNATASTTLPVPEPTGPRPNGYFTKGNPSTGTPATIVDDDWANAVQEEICSVIEESGFTLSKTDNKQLYNAIKQISSQPNIAFRASLGSILIYPGPIAQFKPNVISYNYGDAYDSSSGIFQPTVAGIYKITVGLEVNTGNAPDYVGGEIRKNGARIAGASAFCHIASSYPECTFSADIFLNGTTDYIDFAVGTPAGSASIQGNEASFASAYLVKKI